MKTTLTTLLLSALFMVGCAEDSSFLTSPGTQITPPSNSPNWLLLPDDLTNYLDSTTQFSSSKLIRGNVGGNIILNVSVPRTGHPLGDFQIYAKVRVEKNSFPADEQRMFTITVDSDYLVFDITPSAITLIKPIKVTARVEGIDVSDINPETFSFISIGDNSEILETTNEQLIVDYDENMVMVLNAWIDPLAIVNILPNSRYGWIR